MQNPKRALIALLLVNIIIQTGGSVKDRQMPRPARYVAIAVVFLILSLISDIVPKAQKTAVVFAGLFTLTVALRMVAGKPYGTPINRAADRARAASDGSTGNTAETYPDSKKHKNQRREDKSRQRSNGATGNTKETYALQGG